MEAHPYAKEGQSARGDASADWKANRRRQTSADWKKWKHQPKKDESEIHKTLGAKGSYETLNAAMAALHQGQEEPAGSWSGCGRLSTARTVRTEDELDELELPDALCLRAVALREAAQLVPFQGVAWHILIKESNRLTAIHNDKRRNQQEPDPQVNLLQIEYQSQMADLTRCWGERLKIIGQLQESKTQLEKIDTEITVRTMTRDKVAAQLYAVTKITEKIPRMANPVRMPTPAERPPAVSEAPRASWSSRGWVEPLPSPKQPVLAGPPPRAKPMHQGPSAATEATHQTNLLAPEAEDVMGWCQRVLVQLGELMQRIPTEQSTATPAMPKAWLYPAQSRAAIRPADADAVQPEATNWWLSTEEPTAAEVPMEPAPLDDNAVVVSDAAE